MLSSCIKLICDGASPLPSCRREETSLGKVTGSASSGVGTAAAAGSSTTEPSSTTSEPSSSSTTTPSPSLDAGGCKWPNYYHL